MQNEKSQIRELRAKSGTLYFAAEYPICAHTTVSEFTDYEFLIGLTAIKSRSYKQLFMTERRPDRYRIVDSGVFEDPENPPAPEKLFDIAVQLDADEVVMTDHIGDRDKTLEAAEQFLALSDKFPFKIMAVPQGKDYIEWLQCYDTFVENPRIDVIGLTYYKHPAGLEEVGIANFGIPNRYEGARLALLHLLAGGYALTHQCVNFATSNTEVDVRDVELPDIGVIIPKPFHILGCGQLAALNYYRRFPFVRSIDTSFPVQLGVEGRALRMNSAKAQFKVNFSAKLNRAELALIATNVLRFRQLCHSRSVEEWEVVDRLTIS